MFHTEQQYKMLEQQLQKMKKEIELKEKEVKILKKQNKELKKKLNEYEVRLGITKISLTMDSSNSCKPSSTNGLKIVVQNNRVKSGKKPGRMQFSYIKIL